MIIVATADKKPTNAAAEGERRNLWRPSSSSSSSSPVIRGAKAKAITKRNELQFQIIAKYIQPPAYSNCDVSW